MVRELRDRPTGRCDLSASLVLLVTGLVLAVPGALLSVFEGVPPLSRVLPIFLGTGLALYAVYRRALY